MQASVIWSVFVFEYLCIVLKGAPRILFNHYLQASKYSPAFVEEFTELLQIFPLSFTALLLQGILIFT